MALRLREASSSDYPPERKVTPGIAGTMVLERVLTVYQAISYGVDLCGHEAPGVTMFGLRRRPSSKSLWLKSSDITAEKTFSDTLAQTSML